MPSLRNRIIFAALLPLSFALWVPATLGHAQQADSGESFAPYLERPAVQAFISRIVAEHRFDRESLSELFGAVRTQHKALASLAKPVEKTWEWHEYRRLFVKPTTHRRQPQVLAAASCAVGACPVPFWCAARGGAIDLGDREPLRQVQGTLPSL